MTKENKINIEDYKFKLYSYDKLDAVDVLLELGYGNIIQELRTSYSFREGLGDYADKNKTILDYDITRKISRAHQLTKPKGYNPPEKRLAA